MRRLFYFVFLCVFTLVSCAESEVLDDSSANVESESRSLVEFSAGVATRVVGDAWEVGDRVGLYDNGSVVQKEYEILNAQSGAMGAVLSSDEILHTGDASSYYAYYPYIENLTGTLLSVDLSDQSNLLIDDLLWSNVEDYSDSDVVLEFAHQLVKLNFEVTTTSGSDISSISISCSNVAQSSSFDLMSGGWLSTVIGDLELSVDVESNLRYASASATLIPMDDISNVVVAFEYEGITFSYTPRAEDSAWCGGEEYTYSITIEDGMVEIPVESIVLDQSSIDTYLGESPRLIATVYPEDAPLNDLVWTFSTYNIVTVDDDGYLTPIMSGTTTITVSSLSYPDVKATCEVSVSVQTRDIALWDYLYDDMSYSETYNPNKELLGVVYSLDDDAQGGYVLSMSQRGGTWGITATEYATDTSNGRVNMAIIQALDATFSDYGAMSWCYNLNSDPTFTYTSDMMNVWYMPSKTEIKSILTIIFVNSGDGGEAINAKITAAGGTAFAVSTNYYSSTSNTTYDKPEYAVCSYSSTTGVYTVSSFGSDATASRQTRAIYNFEF